MAMERRRQLQDALDRLNEVSQSIVGSLVGLHSFSVHFVSLTDADCSIVDSACLCETRFNCKVSNFKVI